MVAFVLGYYEEKSEFEELKEKYLYYKGKNKKLARYYYNAMLRKIF